MKLFQTVAQLVDPLVVWYKLFTMFWPASSGYPAQTSKIPEVSSAYLDDTIISVPPLWGRHITTRKCL